MGVCGGNILDQAHLGNFVNMLMNGDDSKNEKKDTKKKITKTKTTKKSTGKKMKGGDLDATKVVTSRSKSVRVGQSLS